MKRTDNKVVTDRCELHLVTEAWESEQEMRQGAQPSVFLLVGPPGGPLARIEGLDLDLLLTLIARVQRSGSRRIAPSDGGCCPPPDYFMGGPPV